MFFRTKSKYAKSSIAIQNSFPRQSHTAENEFIRRFQLCAERLSVETHVVDCSAEVATTGADFLLSLHEVSPKLTPTLTIGAMWNPPSGIRHDPVRCNFAASFDGYLSASTSVTRFIRELTNRFSGPPKPIADFRFFPTSPSGIAQATSHDSLAYLGVHWDGARHGDFLDQLIRDDLVTVYGPESAWRHAGSAYRGGIPFDGTSVIRRLADHGVVLCLHRDLHVAEDTPSMRLFEAASAGCLILSDPIPFAVETFHDTIFLLPEGKQRAEFVRDKLAWARANPSKAQDMARASRAIFERQFSLDVFLPKLIDFGRSVPRELSSKTKHSYTRFDPIIIDVALDLRTNQKFSFDSIDNAINNQTHQKIRVIFIYSEPSQCAFLNKMKFRRGISAQCLFVESDQCYLSAVGKIITLSPFLANLNSNIKWASWHLSSMLYALQTTADKPITFCSSVATVSGETLIDPPNFSGDLLKYLSENSQLVANETKASLQNEGFDWENILPKRSNWLMRSSLIVREDNDSTFGWDFSKVGAQTGLISCFATQETAEGLEVVSFC